MNVMNVVRIAKIVALLAFVLPWVAVSCNNVDVMTASGVELIQGKMTVNPDADKQMNQRMSQQLGGAFGASPGSLEAQGGFGGERDSGMPKEAPELGMNYFAIAAAAVIVIGLLLSFAGKGKTAARNVLVTSLLGLALVFGTVWWWKDQIQKQDGGAGGTASASSPFGGAGSSPFGGGGNPFGGGGGMGAGMVDQILQERFGYWIALAALAVAAGAGAIGMMGGAAGTKPEATPPAV